MINVITLEKENKHLKNEYRNTKISRNFQSYFGNIK